MALRDLIERVVESIDMIRLKIEATGPGAPVITWPSDHKFVCDLGDAFVGMQVAVFASTRETDGSIARQILSARAAIRELARAGREARAHGYK